MHHLYFALGIIALSFLVIIVSNRTYVTPAGRDLEIAPTVDAPVADLEIAPTVDAPVADLEIALTVDAPSRPGDRSYKRRHF